MIVVRSTIKKGIMLNGTAEGELPSLWAEFRRMLASETPTSHRKGHL